MRKTTTLTVGAFLATVSSVALAGTGNGLPPGPHFELQVTAFDNCPAGDFTGSNRHEIAVKENYQVMKGSLGSNQGGTLKDNILKQNTIALSPSPTGDFEVVDGNACDSNGAELLLPQDVSGTYKVYVRLVGAPGTGVGITTCADELTLVDANNNGTPGEIVCSTENVIQFRTSGKGGAGLKFTDYTSQLLTLCLDTNSDGVCDVRLALFDPALTNYFWQWNTDGRAHAQLVFIQVDSP